MCEFISQSYTSLSWNSLLALFFWNLKRDTFNRLEAYGAKELSSEKKQEISFVRKSSVMCEFVSQIYIVLFIEKFPNTAFLESAMKYFRGLRSLWWQRKYLQKKSTKKLSEKLLCEVWINLTELQLYFMELFDSTVFVETEIRYFGLLGRVYSQRKYRRIKTRKEISEKYVSDLLVHLT